MTNNCGMDDLIVIDPPWPLKKILRRARPNQNSALDYSVMTMREIEALPVDALASDNSVVFLWTIQKYLPDAFSLLKKWGFRYQRTMTWDKKNGMSLFGFHHRTEFILFGYKGRIEMYPRQKTVPTIIVSRSGKHSEKPDQFYDMVEHFGNKRLDMFARKQRDGWDVYGDEVQHSIILPPASRA